MPAVDVLRLAKRLVSRRELAARIGTSTHRMRGILSRLDVHVREGDLYDREEALVALGC